MTFFFMTALMTVLWFALFRVVCYALARMFPEGQLVYEALAHYLCAPAALMALASTQWMHPWLP